MHAVNISSSFDIAFLVLKTNACIMLNCLNDKLLGMENFSDE